MTKLENEGPEIVTHRLPKIEVYQVTSDELERIEEESSRVDQEFAIMLTCITVTISFLIALATVTFSTITQSLFIIASAIAAIIAAYNGYKWNRYRKVKFRTINRIRSRKINPDA